MSGGLAERIFTTIKRVVIMLGEREEERAQLSELQGGEGGGRRENNVSAGLTGDVYYGTLGSSLRACNDQSEITKQNKISKPFSLAGGQPTKHYTTCAYSLILKTASG